ncbi:hypothetical protein GNY06_02895 [Elizabethkingia argentiflava]|uniref:Mor transcription activator domain-containing protein n=1 Tax=Elizabethkingia argenteiflava TaxID=2681556 RepID=A0A845PW98_9FLAO|nr:hypothetical protein [Elizabethkingia argenteiflava]NAW50380.1 hypothetical protein [Elizabethkingia argenteiflava]
MKAKRKSKIQDIVDAFGRKYKNAELQKAIEVLTLAKKINKGKPVLKLTAKDSYFRREIVKKSPSQYRKFKFYQIGSDFESGISKSDICAKYNISTNKYILALKKYKQRVNSNIDIPTDEDTVFYS